MGVEGFAGEAKVAGEGAPPAALGAAFLRGVAGFFLGAAFALSSCSAKQLMDKVYKKSHTHHRYYSRFEVINARTT